MPAPRRLLPSDSLKRTLPPSFETDTNRNPPQPVPSAASAESPAVYQCQQCGTMFPSAGKRDAHVRNSHQISATVTNAVGGVFLILGFTNAVSLTFSRENTNQSFKCHCGQNLAQGKSLGSHVKKCVVTATMTGNSITYPS